jgi:hypothetical protein
VHSTLILAEVDRSSPWPALVFGALLVLAAGAMLASHVRTWRRRRNDPELEEGERQHYERQFRRRMQASGIVAIIGVMLPLGDPSEQALIPWRAHPAWLSVYWIIVLGLAMWVMLLAAGDLLATRVHSQVALSRLRQKQRELEREAARLRGRPSNGASDEN